MFTEINFQVLLTPYFKLQSYFDPIFQPSCTLSNSASILPLSWPNMLEARSHIKLGILLYRKHECIEYVGGLQCYFIRLGVAKPVLQTAL